MEDHTQRNESWLERLSEESWQAELVISGIAIFGSFQLLDTVPWLIDFSHFYLPEAFMTMAYFLCIYLLFAISLLCCSLIIHFCIRALWIASIGMESVFPEGIKQENDNFSPGLMKLIIRQYPSLRTFNVYLDQLASSFLGYAFSMVMINAGMVIAIIIALFLGLLLSFFLDEEVAFYLIVGLFAVIFSVIMISGILMNKVTEQRPRWQELCFRVNLFLGKIVSNVFHRPQFYFMYTYRTNLRGSTYYKLMIGSMLLAILILVSQLGSSNLFILLKSNYVRYDLRTDKIYYQNYEEESKSSNIAYVRPMIPAQVIDDVARFSLFLPLPERELRPLMSMCSIPEPETIADRNLHRNAIRAHELDCIQSHILLTIDSIQPVYSVKYYRHPHQNEHGLLYYFPKLKIEEGEHTLTITHQAVQEDGPKIDHIPFVYIGKGD